MNIIEKTINYFIVPFFIFIITTVLVLTFYGALMALLDFDSDSKMLAASIWAFIILFPFPGCFFAWRSYKKSRFKNSSSPLDSDSTNNIGTDIERLQDISNRGHARKICEAEPRSLSSKSKKNTVFLLSLLKSPKNTSIRGVFLALLAWIVYVFVGTVGWSGYFRKENIVEQFFIGTIIAAFFTPFIRNIFQNLMSLGKEMYFQKVYDEITQNGDIKGFSRIRAQLFHIDEFGIINDKKYITEIERVFFAKYHAIFPYIVFPDFYEIVNNAIDQNGDHFYQSEDISEMDGIEYEHYCASLLREHGWTATVSKASGDQGVDIIAEKSGARVAIQCKKYSSPVGNKAVQEIYAAKTFTQSDLAVVVTNNSYTPSAKQLASTNNVLLLHHGDLKNLDTIIFGYEIQQEETEDEGFLFDDSLLQLIPEAKILLAIVNEGDEADYERNAWKLFGKDLSNLKNLENLNAHIIGGLEKGYSSAMALSAFMQGSIQNDHTAALDEWRKYFNSVDVPDTAYGFLYIRYMLYQSIIIEYQDKIIANPALIGHYGNALRLHLVKAETHANVMGDVNDTPFTRNDVFNILKTGIKKGDALSLAETAILLEEAEKIETANKLWKNYISKTVDQPSIKYLIWYLFFVKTHQLSISQKEKLAVYKKQIITELKERNASFEASFSSDEVVDILTEPNKALIPWIEQKL